jgi:hypothetical protein
VASWTGSVVAAEAKAGCMVWHSGVGVDLGATIDEIDMAIQ